MKKDEEEKIKDESEPGNDGDGEGNMGAKLTEEKCKGKKEAGSLLFSSMLDSKPKPDAQSLRGDADKATAARKANMPKPPPTPAPRLSALSKKAEHAMRPGHPVDGQKKTASAMQRNGEFSPERHGGPFNPQTR